MKGDGIARSPDWVSISVRHNPDGDWHHPAAYPPDLAAWMMRLVTPSGGVVCDPFAGSGSTLMAAEAEGFAAVGIERDPAYFAAAQRRIAAARDATPLLPAG